MGIILKKVSIEDYMEKVILYSKQVRGNLPFFIETHYLDNGRHIQIYLYRNHERIKEFIEFDKVKHHLTHQHDEIACDNKQLKITINDKNFMISTTVSTVIKIEEYNFSQQLQDFDKGKVAILIDITLAGDIDNSKTMSEIKSYNNMED